jgi:signal transduction histidine kinase
VIGAIIALACASLGAAYAGLVIRAAPDRRDNVMFGALALTDAAMTAWRGISVASGQSIVSASVTLPCSILTIILSTLTIDFIASFPRRRSMSWRWRTALIAWGIAGGAVVIGVDWRGDWNHAISEWVYYAPATLLTVLLGVRAWRLTSDRDARTVIGMLWFRWIFGFAAYFLGPRLGIFEQLVWAEATAATLISYVVIGTAVLRSDLFSIRGSAAEALLVATIGLIVTLAGGAAVLGTLAYVEPGEVQAALLVGATLLPLALSYGMQCLYPRLEKRVLAPLDDRRARRLGIQDEPLPVVPANAIAESIRRIAAIGDGARVRWEAAARLETALAGRLRSGEPQRRDETPDLPACFIVPAIGADRQLVGAFLIEGGLIDRDTYVVARDLAARIALAVEREEAVHELEDARRLAALGQFAAAIAHDIRTPLTSISLNVQILRQKLQLSEDDREHLDIALEELARLDRSVAEILDFAKPVKLTSEPIDVGELIETCGRSLVPVLSGRGVSVRIEPARPGRDGERDALTVHGDPQRLRQVLTNLVDNAANASRPGAEVTLRAAATGDRCVAIEVEDRGRGIGPDDLPRIFEPFFTTRPDGTGLGLAIVHKVIRAHGGDIRVRSTLGAGSTFTITLPQPA